MMRDATTEEILASGSMHGKWILYIDGASNTKRTILSIVLTTPFEEIIRQVIKYVPLTNNEAEYETVIARLDFARGLDSENVELEEIRCW